MALAEIILIAFGLAMDAFAVSVASGLSVKDVAAGRALKMALFFGLFQAIMPIVGWSAGLRLKDVISGIDHWVAFGLLSFVGAKMILEAFAIRNEEEKRPDAFGTYTLFMLSIATSIDALAVGLTLSVLNVFILSPALIIGIITFFLSFGGVLIGRRFGHFLETKIEIAGGLILIGIGIKILIEHLLA